MKQRRRPKRLNALQNQIDRLERRLKNLQNQSNRFTRFRLITFFTGVPFGILLYYLTTAWLGWLVLGLTLVVFNVIAYFHRKVESSIHKRQIWLDFKKTQIARARVDWNNIPLPPIDEPQPTHPFEIDLDITGRHSLHQLIDTAVSQDGSQLLRDWLLQPHPDANIIEKRQALVKELTPLLRFRDKLYLAYRLVSKERLQSKRLLHFLERTDLPKSFKRVFLLSLGLATSNIVLFILNQIGVLPAFWIVSLMIYGIIYFMNQEPLEHLLEDSVDIAETLRKFKVILLFLENYRYGDNEHLRRFCRPFLSAENRPSTQLRRVTWVGAAVGLRMNPLVRLILNAVVPWDFYFARRLNSLKEKFAEDLPLWLHTWFELEALTSLSNFAYLNPDMTFPKIIFNKDEQIFFTARDLGHPLIPEQQKVSNDFSFVRKGEMALITGSNMSGKSTFLKTIGINLCLAFAGGPVDAAELHTSLFRIFTCIQINDSVTDGFSFFYSEVKRLKNILNELQKEDKLPLLFLIDEIFKGTNNRERLLGSRSYIQALAGQNGLGAITTHDLELTHLAEKIPELKNYHFKEEVIDGKMVFDYKLRPGPCPTTNALKIMKMEGLPVCET